MPAPRLPQYGDVNQAWSWLQNLMNSGQVGNLPTDKSREEILDIYQPGWRTGPSNGPPLNTVPGAQPVAQVGYDRAADEAGQIAQRGIFGVGGVGRGIGTGGGASPMGGGASFGTQQMMGGASSTAAAPMQRAYVPSWGARKYKEVRPWSPLPTYRR